MEEQDVLQMSYNKAKNLVSSGLGGFYDALKKCKHAG